MPKLKRSALVEQPATTMFDLVNDLAAYPQRFDWCEAAEVLQSDDSRVIARLDLGLGAFRTWFTTENRLSRPTRIDMSLRDGPFKRLEGCWQFDELSTQASKVTLTLDFDPRSRLMLPALTLGFKGLADRMVDDFVRVADQASA